MNESSILPRLAELVPSAARVIGEAAGIPWTEADDALALRLAADSGFHLDLASVKANLVQEHRDRLDRVFVSMATKGLIRDTVFQEAGTAPSAGRLLEAVRAAEALSALLRLPAHRDAERHLFAVALLLRGGSVDVEAWIEDDPEPRPANALVARRRRDEAVQVGALVSLAVLTEPREVRASLQERLVSRICEGISVSGTPTSPGSSLFAETMSLVTQGMRVMLYETSRSLLIQAAFLAEPA